MRRRLTIVITILLGVCISYATGKRALLIGISDYPVYSSMPEMSWEPIHGCNDVKLLASTLERQGFTTITSLLNQNATADNIRLSLKQLEADSRSGDLVYIHFSGHGQAFEDLSGDEEDEWDEAIIPYDAMMQYSVGVYDGSKHIIDDELESYISLVRKKIGTTGYVYVVLDACHMGGASRGDETEEEQVFLRGTDIGFTPNNKLYVPKIDRRGNMQIASEKDMADISILEACRAYQTNTEIKENGIYYGALSFYVNHCFGSFILSSNTAWAETVRSLMNKDKRLIKQNMVNEKSN